MHSSDVGDCCGVKVLYDFELGWHRFMQKEIKQTQKRIKNLLTNRLRLRYFKDEEGKETKNQIKEAAYYLIILNENQKEHLHEIISSFGFEIVKERMNPNTGNFIHLYMKEI